MLKIGLLKDFIILHGENNYFVGERVTKRWLQVATGFDITLYLLQNKKQNTNINRIV